MPKYFEPEMRVQFENTAKGFYPAVVNKLREMDKKAKSLKEQGKNARAELAPELDKLKADVDYTTMKTVDAYRGQIDDARKEYEARRDKNAIADLAALQRAQSKINSMTNKELQDYAMKVGSDVETPSLYEAEAAMSRLGDIPERYAIADRVKKDLIDRPWLQNDTGLQDAHKEAEMLESAPPGSVLADGVAIDLEHLVDFDGELDNEI